jgi:hypothetical protein
MLSGYHLLSEIRSIYRFKLLLSPVQNQLQIFVCVRPRSNPALGNSSIKTAISIVLHLNERGCIRQQVPEVSWEESKAD